MRRYLIGAVSALLVGVMVFPATALAAKPNRVDVCHVDKSGVATTVNVPEKVAAKHLDKHPSDSPGPCSEEPPPIADCYSAPDNPDLDYNGVGNTLGNITAHSADPESPCNGSVLGTFTLVLADDGLAAANTCEDVIPGLNASPQNLASRGYTISSSAWLCTGG